MDIFSVDIHIRKALEIEQATREMDINSIDSLGLSEVWWDDSEKQSLFNGGTLCSRLKK